MAKKSYSTGKVLFYTHRSLVVCQFLVCWFVSDACCDVSLCNSLQIKLVSQNYIILFTSLKVQRSTLLLNSRHLMLNLKNKIGMAEVNRTVRTEGRKEGGEREKRNERQNNGRREGEK